MKFDKLLLDRNHEMISHRTSAVTMLVGRQMLFLFILVAFAAAMFAMGVSALEVAIACGMVLLCMGGFTWGERWVQRRTGRTAVAPTELYKGVTFLVAMLFGLPPIYLLSNYHVLVLAAFQMLGLVVGSICAQAFLGKRIT